MGTNDAAGPTQDTPSGLRSRRARVSTVLVAFGIVALVFAAYLPAIRGEFLITDDRAVSRNPHLTADDGLRRIWFTTESEQYQPLVYTSFWLERRAWGLWPAGYHVVNLTLHAANALLLWLLLSKLGVRAAALAAALFAIHPVNVESVAWIYERKNVLSGLFYFLTLVAFFRFERDRGWRWYAAALLLFVAALLAKASTVVLPAVLLLYWWWRRSTPWRRNVALVAPFVVLAGLMAALTIWYEQHHTGAVGAEYAAGHAERFARSGWIVAFALRTLLVPYNLTFFYPRWSVDPAAALSYLPHAVILVALVVFLAKRRTWGRAALFGVAYYLIALFPVMGFFDIYYHRVSLVADHFQYLPMVGVIALTVHAIAHGLDRLASAKALSAENSKAVGQGLTIVALVACGFLTWQRAGVFQSTEKLCRDTLRHNPDSWIAHHKLGEYLQRRYPQDTTQLHAAMQHFRRALELKPEHPHVLEGLGNTLRMLRRDADALPYLRRAVDADPDNAVFRVNLGAVLAQMGQLSEAITHYEHAVRCRPDLPTARLRLGEALLRSGRPADAIPHLREAVRLDPKDTESASFLRQAEWRLHAPTSAPAAIAPMARASGALQVVR